MNLWIEDYWSKNKPSNYHWSLSTKKGREKITKELILDILREELNNKRFLPTNYSGTRKVYLRDKILHKDKRYRLIFWFKDGSDDHLWIRNCHGQD